MGIPDRLSRRLGEAKSEIYRHISDKGQLLDLENNDVGEKEGMEDMELEGIDVVTQEKKTGLWVVLQEHLLEVLHQNHDSQVAGHWGRHRTRDLVSENFIWKKLVEDVAKYVAGYIKRQKSQAGRHRWNTKLVAMPTGARPFEEIEIDFLRELPESIGFHPILVVTDQFTKVQLYIPAKTTQTA